MKKPIESSYRITDSRICWVKRKLFNFAWMLLVYYGIVHGKYFLSVFIFLFPSIFLSLFHILTLQRSQSLNATENWGQSSSEYVRFLLAVFYKYSGMALPKKCINSMVKHAANCTACMKCNGQAEHSLRHYMGENKLEKESLHAFYMPHRTSTHTNTHTHTMNNVLKKQLLVCYENGLQFYTHSLQ